MSTAYTGQTRGSHFYVPCRSICFLILVANVSTGDVQVTTPCRRSGTQQTTLLRSTRVCSRPIKGYLLFPCGPRNGTRRNYCQQNKCIINSPQHGSVSLTSFGRNVVEDRQAVTFFAVKHNKAISLPVYYINRPYSGSTLGISPSVMLAAPPPTLLNPTREAVVS